MKVPGVLVCAAALLAVSGCGGGSSSTGSPAHADQSVTLNLWLHDAGSLDALFNLGGGICSTSNVAEALQASSENPGVPVKQLRGLLPTTKVTVADAAGKTVAVKTLPRSGGLFSQSKGCEWPLQLVVAPSDFYDVTVEHDTFSKSEQFQQTTRRIDFVF